MGAVLGDNEKRGSQVRMQRYKSKVMLSGFEDIIYWSLTQYFNQDGKLIGKGYFVMIDRKEKLKIKSESQLFRRCATSSGMCLFCGELDFTHLEEHHPYPDELSDVTLTFCANCHRTIHFYTGGNRGIRRR